MGAPAFGFVKSTQSSVGSGTSLAITIPAARLNSLLVVSMKFNSAVSAISITDNASTPNTYAATIGNVGATPGKSYVSYGIQVVGGATVITISWTGSSAARITVDEYTGGQLTNALVLDTSGTATGTGTSAALSSPITPASAGELIVAMLSLNSGASAVVVGSGFVFGTNNASTSTEYKQVGTTSETGPITWTTSVVWSLIVVAFKPATPNGNAASALRA